jgi:hypothetical protein
MLRISKIIGICFFATGLYFLQACEESEATTKVITENVLFVSAEQAKLSGRIFGLASSADDHGFQIDVSEVFNTPIEISLGPMGKLGKFIGEIETLTPHTTYYYRAYVKEGSKISFGDSKSFETGSPSFKTMSPTTGYAGTIVTITGGNIPQGVKVLLGNKEALIYSLSLESTLQFVVPQPIEGDNYLGEVKFVMGLDTVTFDQPFEYITGKWKKLDNFIEPLSIYNGVTFKQGNQLYFGLGVRRNPASFNKRIWRLDLESWSWTELAITTNGFYSGFSGTQGYFGAGAFNLEAGVLNKKFWQAVGDDFVELNDLPFGLFIPISATVNEALYVGGGQTAVDVNNFNLYKYNSSLDGWEVETTLPFAISSNYGVFSYQDQIYFLIKDGSLWTYHTVSKVWTKISKSPFIVKTGSICTVIGSKVYFGVGLDNTTLLEYDIVNNTWKEKYKFTGDRTFINVGFFSHNEKIYTLRINPFGSASFTEIWEFDPQAF